MAVSASSLHPRGSLNQWSELRADCGKYRAELEKEEALGKYTPAELENGDEQFELYVEHVDAALGNPRD